MTDTQLGPRVCVCDEREKLVGDGFAEHSALLVTDSFCLLLYLTTTDSIIHCCFLSSPPSLVLLDPNSTRYCHYLIDLILAIWTHALTADWHSMPVRH